MDPLSALSISAAVVQFFDFTTQIVCKSKDIYSSANGSLAENDTTQTVADRLEQLTAPISRFKIEANAKLLERRLKAYPEASREEIRERVKQVNDHLKQICGECSVISKDLKTRLEALKVPKRSENKKWKSFRQALKTVWSKREIDDLADRLMQLRGELDTHVLLHLKESQEVESLYQDARFQKLDQNTRAIIKGLAEVRRTQTEVLERHIDDLKQWQQRAEVSRANLILQECDARRTRVELDILESLRFPEMNHRYEAVAHEHENTFQWILKDPSATQMRWDSFSKWLSYGTGMYWIQGKAASGKSTLMRFIWNHPSTFKCLRDWSHDSVLITGIFFFWNSGVQEQRSQSGLLRTLLYEVLKRQKTLIEEVFPDEWERKSHLVAHGLGIGLESRSLGQLKRAFNKLVGLAGPKLRMCFFLDGLDEFEGDAQDIAEYSSQLSQHSEFAKFCVSSRPWMAFQHIFDDTPGLRLQDLNRDDIESYVGDKLGKNQLMQRLLKQDPQKATWLVREVTDKASGVFLWVVLVVKSLITGLQNGDNISHLRRRLSKLPADLESLFDHMFDRIDVEDKQDSSIIFQVFRASGNDLDILTLYRALLCSRPHEAMEIEIDLTAASDDKYMDFMLDMDRMVSRVNSRSMGLLEVHETPWVAELSDDQETSNGILKYSETLAVFQPQWLPTEAETLRKLQWDQGREEWNKSREKVAHASSEDALEGKRHRMHVNGSNLDSFEDSSPQSGQPVGYLDPQNLSNGLQTPPDEQHQLDCRQPTGTELLSPILQSLPSLDSGSKGGGQAPAINGEASAASYRSNGGYIGYLHRTVMDYLQQTRVWAKILDQTKGTSFNPSTSLNMALVVQAKTEDLGLEVDILRQTGLKMFKKAAKWVSSPTNHDVELLEHLDSVLTLLRRYLSLDEVHWLNNHPKLEKDNESPLKFQTDVMAAALLSRTFWFIEAKMEPSTAPKLPMRHGLPILAYALHLHAWSLPISTSCPDRDVVEWCLKKGADPNEVFEGLTVWQYTIHALHVLHSKDKALDRREAASWVPILQVMLVHGADPHACCSASPSCFSQGLCLPTDGVLARDSPAITQHTAYQVVPKPSSHSVMEVVNDVYKSRGSNAVDELLSVLNEKIMDRREKNTHQQGAVKRLKPKKRRR